MKQTVTTPDVTTEELDDLDFQYVCEVSLAFFWGDKVFAKKPCQEPAKWVGNYPCCGHLAVLCAKHLKADTTFKCAPCDKEFHHLVAVRPL